VRVTDAHGPATPYATRRPARLSAYLLNTEIAKMVENNDMSLLSGEEFVVRQREQHVRGRPSV